MAASRETGIVPHGEVGAAGNSPAQGPQQGPHASDGSTSRIVKASQPRIRERDLVIRKYLLVCAQMVNQPRLDGQGLQTSRLLAIIAQPARSAQTSRERARPCGVKMGKLPWSIKFG